MKRNLLSCAAVASAACLLAALASCERKQAASTSSAKPPPAPSQPAPRGDPSVAAREPDWQRFYNDLDGQQREVVDKTENPTTKDLRARGMWLRDRPAIGLEEVRPLVDHLEASERDEHKYDDAWVDDQFAMAAAARAWVQQGPFSDFQQRLEAQAVRYSRGRDEGLRTITASLIWAIAANPSDKPLSKVAVEAYKKLAASESVASRLEKQKGVLQAARAAMKLPALPDAPEQLR